MSNKIAKFLKEKVLTLIIQFTIGLILPWWVIDLINRQLVEDYGSKFNSYNKLSRYTIGLILPWWILFLLEGNKMSVSSKQMDINDYSDSSSEKEGSTQKNFYCPKCNMHVVLDKSPQGSFGNKYGAKDNCAHNWHDLGKVGDYKFTCELCGTTIFTPNHWGTHSSKCKFGAQHKWKKEN